MNQERNTLSRGYEIDLRDLLARLVRRWWVVLIVVLIGALLGGGFAVLKNRAANDDNRAQAGAQAAGDALTPQQKEHIAFVHSEYLSLREYRNSLENYLAGSLYSEDELTDSVTLTSMYYIDSSIENVNQVLRILSLNGEDYEKIAQILGTDAEHMDDVYRRICVTEVPARSAVQQDIKTADGKNNVLVTKETQTALGEHLLQVWVIAPDEEQAAQVLSVAEDSFARTLNGLKEVDPQVRITSLGQNVSGNVADFLIEKEADIVTRMKEVGEQIYYLEDNYLDDFTDAEEAYYNALDAVEAANPKQEVSSASSGWKKKALIGAIIGLILGCVLVILQYLLDGRIKTARELKERFGVDVPYVAYRRKHPGNPLGGAARGIARTPKVSDEVVRSMAASDIALQLKKTGISSVCLICDRVTPGEEQMAQDLISDLKGKAGDLNILACDPCASAEQLEQFSGAKGAILAVQMKKTRAQAVEQWTKMCGRYQIPIVSVIALEEC